MALFKSNADEAAPKEEKEMAVREVEKVEEKMVETKPSTIPDALETALHEVSDAAQELINKANGLLNVSNPPAKHSIEVKRCRRASITLSDELVELRKVLP